MIDLGESDLVASVVFVHESYCHRRGAAVRRRILFTNHSESARHHTRGPDSQPTTITGGNFMRMDAHQKVNASHLKRNAYLYIRQSTIRQLVENTESTKRQYGLRQHAMALG
jgi:hypothetical protein